MKIARIISRLFNPFIGFIVLFFFAALKSEVFGWNLIYLMSTFFVTMVLPPALLLLWAVQTKWVVNWDLSNRKERVWALLIFGLFLFCDFFIIQRIGTTLMNDVFRFLLILFTGFFLITLRYKISGHMMVATYVVLLLISWYGIFLVPLLFILPILAWSRVTLKRHTIGEVILGIVYPLFFFIILITFRFPGIYELFRG